MTTCTPRAAWGNLLRRLHFYIGLFVGPFIFFAALTLSLIHISVPT
ncbi:PepSY domain-containing protein, partial [Enterobacter sp. 63]